MQKNAYPRNVRYSWYLVCAAAIVVILDEWIKMVVLVQFAESIHKNSGILFNIPLPLTIVVPATIALSAILLFVAYQRPSALVIVLGGAGNLYDRLVYRYTVDYLYLPGGLTFNLSDVIIVLGILWFLLGARSSTRAVDNTAKH